MFDRPVCGVRGLVRRREGDRSTVVLVRAPHANGLATAAAINNKRRYPMADQVVPSIRTFQVFPDVPQELQPLLEMAGNFWWVWHPDAVELFAGSTASCGRTCTTTRSSCSGRSSRPSWRTR